jgi:hypothetical protein
MEASKTGERIDIVSSSGMLRVVLPPRRSWFLILLEIVLTSVGVIWVYTLWARLSGLYHLLFLWGIATAFLVLIYQISVSQTIEFDSQRITVRKEFRGLERKKEYRVEDCSELEWQESSEGQPAALRYERALESQTSHSPVVDGSGFSNDRKQEDLFAVTITLLLGPRSAPCPLRQLSNRHCCTCKANVDRRVSSSRNA